MEGLLKKAWRVVKEEAVGLPMAVLTLVVAYAAVRFLAAQADKSQPGLGAKIKSYFTV